MKLLKLVSAILLGSMAFALPAQADFGFKSVSVTSRAADGSLALEAGSHPFRLTTGVAMNVTEAGGGAIPTPDQQLKDLKISFPPGLVGDPTAVPRCTNSDFLAEFVHGCSDSAAIGTALVEFGSQGAVETELDPVYNLNPVPGKVARVGFIVQNRAPVFIDVGVNPLPPYNVVATTTNTSQAVFFYSAEVTIWGDPSSAAHDPLRGSCAIDGGSCPFSGAENAFLVLPTSCRDPLGFGFEADSWQNPDPAEWARASAAVEDEASEPAAPTGCQGLAFEPQIAAEPTTRRPESPSGLDLEVSMPNAGILEPEGTAASTIQEAVVTLPRGLTINPSQANGLAACSETQLFEEQAQYREGHGCPAASRIGGVSVTSPLLEGVTLNGGLFVATPYQNPAKSLIAVYMIFREPDLGVVVRQTAKVEPDPRTGQLVASVKDVPDLPFDHFDLHFLDGPRASLVTPASCGSFTTQALFTPRARPGTPYSTTAQFEITPDPADPGCSSGGTGLFSPHFEGGSSNRTAGHFSPFAMQIRRRDGEEELTRLSAILPRGVSGDVAGLARCPDSAIGAARSTSGLTELANASCPSGSEIGRVIAGAGVGADLTYVEGTLYLAGPYRGAPLSVVGIVPAVAGPFDLGNVVAREALDVNPLTAEVELSSDAADSFPHILDGIPLRLRDLQIRADRPDFVLNPTSCEPEQLAANLFGSGGNPLDPGDDVIAPASVPYQVDGCGSLGFKPRLSLRFKGRTRHRGHPALTAVLRTRTGDANVGRTAVVLPKSELLDQAHINAPCTRPVFVAGDCPRRSILGTVEAVSPLLPEPLKGLVYFRANGGERPLPDIVLDLRGLFHATVIGQVDSVRGRLRTVFPNPPDVPVSKLKVQFFGGHRGLLVNTVDLCAKRRRAAINIKGQNGRPYRFDTSIKTRCHRHSQHKR